MQVRYVVAPRVYLAAVAAVVVLFTLVFSHYTATSAYSFPRFLLALPFFVYLPGRFLLDSTRLQVRALEHLSLSLVLGLLASSFTYWVAMGLHAPVLFLLLPLGATAGCAYRASRQGMAPEGWSLNLDRSHLMLLGVLALLVGLLGVAPIYYRNMILRPDGGLRFRNIPDVTLHLALSNELTHTVPPQTPFISGRPLSYHYASDLPAAYFSTFAGLSTLDLTVRYVPTLFLMTTALAVFAFCRSWLGSGRAAALATFLIILGEDFSWIPGLLLDSKWCWSAQFFGTPTTFCLYTWNPMLPGLGVFFAGLFCLRRYFLEGSRGWLVLGALFFATVLEYKVFIAAQVMLALAVSAVVYLVVFRDRKPLLLFGLTGLILLVLAVPMWLANAASAHQTMRIHHTEFLTQFIVQLGLDKTASGRWMLDLVDKGMITKKRLVVCLLVVLPAFLVGSLGSRVIGLFRVVKALVVPTGSSAPRFFLALFVVLGPLLSLTCVVASADRPLDDQYNNAVWFFVLSKYVAWLFAVECLCGAAWLGHRRLQAAAALLLVALAVPSTVQFFRVGCMEGYYTSNALSRSEVEVMTFLDTQGSPGQVAVARREVGLPITALTTSRSPISALQAFTDNFARADEVQTRREDWNAFWYWWQQGNVRADTLSKYGVTFLVVDKAEGRLDLPGAGPDHGYATGAGRVLLTRCFENEGFVVFRVRAVPAAALAARR